MTEPASEQRRFYGTTSPAPFWWRLRVALWLIFTPHRERDDLTVEYPADRERALEAERDGLAKAVGRAVDERDALVEALRKIEAKLNQARGSGTHSDRMIEESQQIAHDAALSSTEGAEPDEMPRQ